MRVEFHLSLSELTALERCEKSAERARRMRIMILAMSGWTYASGEVHVDWCRILRGFPGERLWDGDGTRRSSGQRGLMSSGIRG
jgi:hypothetical protein